MRKSRSKNIIPYLEKHISDSKIADNRVFSSIEHDGYKIRFAIKMLRTCNLSKNLQVTNSRLKDVKKRITVEINKLYLEYSIMDRDTILKAVSKEVLYCENENRIAVSFNKIKTELDLLNLENETTLFEEFDDYHQIFFRARNRKRKIIAYLGETNSGKTFNAMSAIANSFTSAYLAPLRLLALETYEYLNSQGIVTDLITGEEKIFNDNAVCQSSTVECFNFEKDYDTVVIDEIQMIDDPDRGGFFVQALVGANADNIILTGPKEYKDRLQYIANYIGEEIEVHEFNRKTTLKPIKHEVNLNNVKKGTAIVVFSRKDIFKIREQLPANIKSSVIYGALGYEVRKLQAERFINGETDVLITTDAIGMGLNLPIETVIFTTNLKFNGKNVEPVSHMLTKQICGRAGRFGKYDIGYYGGVNGEVINHINHAMKRPLNIMSEDVLSVQPTDEYIEVLLEKYNLSSILTNWSSKKFNGSLFTPQNLDEKVIIARFLEKKYPEQVKEFYRLVHCPINFKKDYEIYIHIVKQLLVDKKITLPTYDTNSSIINLESANKELNILLWFAHQYSDYLEFDKDTFIEKLKLELESVNTSLHKKLSKGN